MTWCPLEEGPELPDDVPTVNQLDADKPLRWWAADAEDGAKLWAVLGGDCGAEGPYIAAVYVEGGSRVYLDREGAPVAADYAYPRYPTFEEWTSFVGATCVPGAVLSCGYVAGSDLIEPASGWRVLMLVQTTVLPGTLAHRRAVLADKSGILSLEGARG